MRKYLLIGVSSFVLGAGAMAYLNRPAAADTPSAQAFKMLELFGDVHTIIKKQYVTPVDDKKLIQAAIDGMLTSLDPHSGYLNPDDYSDMRDQTRGEYGGLGIEVTSDEGAVKVVSPMDDTPAARAGIQSGDYITAIDGQSVIGLPLSEAVKKMRGAIGQPINLTIARQGKDPFDVKLVRESINVKSAKGRMEGDYGYLRVSAFDEKTTEQAAAAIKDLQLKNPKMKGLVLDLRNNPGGLLDQAVGISSLFLDGGEVVSQRGRDPKDIDRYNARPHGDVLHGLPMVVLINSGTASAAEIVSGALQDRHRAAIVGLTSFGKGSVQTVIPLRGGEDGALKLTTARYFTPSGRSIQKTGIEPDLEVAETYEQAEAVANEAFQFSEASFSNALNAEEGKIRRAPHEPAEAPPPGFDPKKDFQLQRGEDVLKYGSVAATPRMPTPKPKLASVLPGKGPAALAPGATATPAKPAEAPAAKPDAVKPAAPAPSHP
ncbi:MAG: S41 family peptidase [Caulobacteraceae bacterium]|nr:S41 family peptidase [Caulobacteraceae bacterium]